MLKLNHLTGFGSGVAAAAGGDVTSYVFDGTGDYLSIPDHADFDVVGSISQDYTIDFWVRFTDHASQESLIEQFEDTSNFWRIDHNDGSGLTLLVKSGGSSIINMGRSGEITDTDWHHIALCKVTNGSVEWGLYVDGAQVSYLSDNSTDTFAGSIYVGIRGDGSSNPFDGNIDEMRITNTNSFSASPNATPDDTITVPTSQHTSDANTLLLIHGGEAYTGALTGETTQSCVTFDGTGDYLSVPDHADWEFGAGEFTVDFWINTTQTGTADRFMGRWGASGKRTFALQFGSDNKLHCNYSDDGDYSATFQIEENDANTINDGAWHHVAVTGNTTDNLVKMFIDGTVQADTAAMTTIFANDLSWLIGDAGLGESINANLSEIRILKGAAAWTTSFTPSTTRYTSDANTVLLIHGDEVLTTNWASGITGSGATFTDSGNTGHTVTEVGNAISARGGTFTDSGNTGHTVSENGQAQKETEQEFKFADDGVGYFLDGTGDYLSIPDHADWNFGDGDLTIELWIYLFDVRPVASGVAFFDQHVDGGNRVSFVLNNNNTLAFYAQYSSSWIISTSQTHGLRNNTWHHIAVVKDGNDWEFFQDGVSLGSATDAGTLPDLAANPTIGFWEAASIYVKGYIDEYRISDVARYITGFIPSTTQFTSDANTLLLIHGGEAKSGTTGSGATFTDSGNTGHTVTENGNAIESTGNFYKF